MEKRKTMTREEMDRRIKEVEAIIQDLREQAQKRRLLFPSRFSTMPLNHPPKNPLLTRR